MASETDPLGIGDGVKKALEQTHQAMDNYFDMLKQSVSTLPSGGTAIGEKWKEEGLQNIAALQELMKRLSQATTFAEALQIQTAFIHSQVNKLAKQTTNIGAFMKPPGGDKAG
jgi:hypothetical protein